MAAAVFVPPSPHDPFSNMATTSRRAPLANIPNATNSPHRFLTTSGSKRPRALANITQQENEPPQKKQAIDKGTTEPSPAVIRRQVQNNNVEGRVFERSRTETASTSFQRRLVAARDRDAVVKVTKNVEQSAKDESIQQWQKHYRKQFPSFSFYFDNVAEDVRARFIRHITALGAKEERFFSKSVTHIVTTRPIPLEPQYSKSPDSSESTHVSPVEEQLQTINPSLLEKNGQSTVISRNQQGVAHKRDGVTNLDILARGRQMGMKIWAVEKLNRILSTIFNDAGAQAGHARSIIHNTRGQQEDLSQVLRNEKLGVASERDQTSFPRELIPFKGPFIYIHDIDEKVRPTMVRDYPKVAKRQDGEWPQFRSAGIGKCPFVEDPGMKREVEQEKAKQKALLLQQQKETQQIPRTRSTTHLDTAKMEPPRRDATRKRLQEINNTAPIPAAPDTCITNKPTLSRMDSQPSFPPMPDRQTFEFIRPSQLQISREPTASGIQRSNLTSAIQSQMISSTAAAGIKAGTSKEVHELKRKVLERTHTGSLSVGSIPSSHRMNDLTGSLKNSRAPAPQRAAKSKAQEKLGGIQEEAGPGEDDVAAENTASDASKRKKTVKKDPKPGYCENCRDKYDDFDDHIVSRKHRKFAMTQSNWTELDALLAKLQQY